MDDSEVISKDALESFTEPARETARWTRRKERAN